MRIQSPLMIFVSAFISVIFLNDIVGQADYCADNFHIKHGTGNGITFSNSSCANTTYFTITKGVGPEYQYGRVTNSSIKNSMDSASVNGWTWGVKGEKPVLAVNTSGHLTIRGHIYWGQSFFRNAGKNSGIELRGYNGTPYIDFTTNQSTDFDARLMLKDENTLALYGGSLSIGTHAKPTCTEYLLSVDGKIIAEELKVQLSEDWCDYVFDEENFELMSLEEKEHFTNENNHLPAFEPAAIIDNEGLELGVNLKNAVQELEEAYLHIFKLNKTIDEQQSLIKDIQNRLTKLEHEQTVKEN